jgi:hypothetical protein
MLSRFNHVEVCISILFYSQIILHYIPLNGHKILCSFISWWTFGLIAHFDYYEKCCYRCSGTSFCVDKWFISLEYVHRSGVAHVNFWAVAGPCSSISAPLHSYQQWSWFLHSHSLPALTVILFLIAAPLVGVKWHMQAEWFWFTFLW